jgi:hypothetical protein
MIWNNTEERYKIIFNIIPNPAVLLDLDNKVEAINDSCLEYFENQIPKDVIYGQKVKVEKIFPWLANELSALMSGEARETVFDQELICPKGQVIFQVRIKKILDPFDIHRNTLILMNDITSIVEAEKKVARARDFYLTLFEEFPAMIWRAGADGQFNYFNRAWLGLHRKMVEEQLGYGWAQLCLNLTGKGFSGFMKRPSRSKKPLKLNSGSEDMMVSTAGFFALDDPSEGWRKNLPGSLVPATT